MGLTFRVTYLHFLLTTSLLHEINKKIMPPLIETQRIEALIMVKNGDRTRAHQAVFNLFNIKYPDTLITQFIIN